MHHVVSDFISLAVLVREMTVFYLALSRGERAVLPEPPIQYADFAVWQREWLAEEVLASELAFWRERLAGAPAVIDLPLDRPRPLQATFRGASRGVVLPAALAAGIEELGRRSGCTLYMTLLAGWQALLSCLSGLDGRPRQEDVVVGSPIAGRDWAEVEGLIGFFVNTLVMRNDLSGDPTFRELLARTREMALAAIAHRHVPFDRLVEELKPERSLALNPLFQVAFNFLATGTAEPVAVEPDAALAVTPYRLEDETAQFDLVLVLGEGPDGLAGALQYKTDLFESGTVDWIVEQYRSLLERAVAEPEVRLSELGARLAEAAERRRAAVERELGEASAQKFKTTRRRAVTASGSPGEIDRR
jgi:non-ribosomal peptide synthetase component F